MAVGRIRTFLRGWSLFGAWSRNIPLETRTALYELRDVTS